MPPGVAAPVVTVSVDVPEVAPPPAKVTEPGEKEPPAPAGRPLTASDTSDTVPVNPLSALTVTV